MSDGKQTVGSDSKRKKHMATQKAKFELFSRLQAMGFAYDEAQALRRIEMTLNRWAALECGDGDQWKSWAIERDQDTDKPYMVIHPNDGKSHRYAVADREAGALRRLAAIMKSHPDFVAYHQTDPRGCSLYIVRKADVLGCELDQVYNRGLAVAA